MGAVKRILGKLRRDGFRTTAKVTGRIIHERLFPTSFDFELVPALLEKILAERGAVTLVQIGANTGNTGTDQLYKFIARHGAPGCQGASKVRAVLIEPVRHLYEQLGANYAGFAGVTCVQAAIAETSGTKPFYRLREGINLAEHGLPAYAEELGSFLRENLSSLWAHDPANVRLREFVQANIVEESIPCLRLEEVLRREKITDLDLLQIDTEGYDYAILRSLDFTRFKPCYINYERIHLGRDEAACRRMLLYHGYSLQDHGQDTLCTAKARLGSLKRFREWAYGCWLETIH
jgi:FkbM family methyltransferase